MPAAETLNVCGLQPFPRRPHVRHGMKDRHVSELAGVFCRVLGSEHISDALLLTFVL
jgi:hypothetical protein